MAGTLEDSYHLNAICPYFTMFPVSFPLHQLRRARPGDRVLDPFCGRGTTLYAARLLGLPTVGIDSNPVAVAIAEAKLLDVTPESIVRACERIIANAAEPRQVPAGEFWRWCYHPETLREICVLREALARDSRTQARKGLRALVLGRLHGPLNKGLPSYLSNQMPRTFASKPDSAVRFWRRRGMSPPKVSLIDIVQRWASRYFGRLPPHSDGSALLADSRQLPAEHLGAGFRWIVTSPPYYGMRTYVSDQWLRAWFLGGPPQVTYSSEDQFGHQSPEDFSAQLACVWRRMAAVAAPSARMVVRFGGIHDRSADPRGIFLSSVKEANAGWQVKTSVGAGSAGSGKRQAGQFGRHLRAAIEERDYYLTLQP